MADGKLYDLIVAPFTGAWIEIDIDLTFRRRAMQSLPSRERGLKYHGAFRAAEDLWSLPSRERGLKSRWQVDYKHQ